MKNFLPLFLLFFTLNLFSQKEANFWYFGNNAALDFNSGNPLPVSGSQLNTTEGCSSFSDANGNLLFYVGAPTPQTNNLTIWNKNNQPMPNGIGLQGDASSSQSALTIPAPGKPNIYYLFTVGAQSSSNAGFWYYTIDMTANGGLGDVVDGPIVLGNLADHPTWSEKVTAVRAKDCNTFWVISYQQGSFYSYKVNDTGVDISNPIISPINGYFANDPRGYLKVSPDGKKLVAANMADGTFIFDFNDETGQVQNFNNGSFPNRLIVNGEGYGVEFSASSRRLYISTGSFQPSTENLHQFDLTKPNINEINDSSFLVHSYFNTRGALQLGPNGKIYWTSDLSGRISVINKPEELGAKVDYSHQTVDLGGFASATQGLPPFLSSLLLPIEITDAETNLVINNEELEFCIGQNKTIRSERITGNNISYDWTFDDGRGPNSISTDPDLVLNNLLPANAGTYSLTIELTDDCGNITQYVGTFSIEVFEAAVATKPTNIVFCDVDRDGFNSFDLNTLKDAEVLNGLDNTLFEVIYFDSQANANANTNPLPNPYTNPTTFSSQIIYARVQNSKAIEACFDITEFTLSVTDLPIPTQPTPYRICDDTESVSDTDGIINTFLLNTKDDEIYGTLDKSQYNISYHTTQIGAENNDVATVIDKNANYSVTNNQTVFIRMENKDNTACYDANQTLGLIVDELPVISNNPATLQQCDTDPDKQTTFNLTEAEINISSNYQNETFTYFATEADATAGTPEVADKTAYFVDTTGEAWVRTISQFGCFRISKIELTVSFTPNEPYEETFSSCDDFLDADGNNTATNSDTDGITFFDFSSAPNQISIDPDIEIEFYETEDERTRSINEIQSVQNIANYRNKNIPNTKGNRFPIFYKLISKTNNNCQGLGVIYLQVDPVPAANTVQNLELCDDALDGDATNGIVQSFDLESQTTTILGAQNPADFTVTYHLSANDANAGNNAQTSPFANTIRDSQPIFVRVTNNTTGCFTDHTTFNVIVNPLPIANFVADLEICDDNSDGSARNGFSQTIDLESQTTGILGSQDPSVFSVTYHRSLSDAQAGNNPLISPYSNNTPNRETIFVRVFNANTQCANGISNFDVIVNPEPTFETVSNLSYCDNDLDGDDTNGIIQNIDLDSQIAGLLGASQDPDDFTVTFHLSQTDAATGTSNLVSPYQNTNTTETFFVRIQNKRTLCVNDDASFDVIVNPLPDFTVTTPQILCLNDLPLNIFVENPRDNYTYEWKNESGTVISTSDNADITTGGTYTVLATTTNGTMCSRTETIVVNESNPATLQEDYITIIDESNNIGSRENLSIYINNVDNDLGPGDYQFAILNTDNNERTPFAGYQDEPLFENLEGGIYQIIVNDKNGCVPDATLLVSVIQFPKFFTPNGDSQNDTWVVKGANQTFYPNAKINIFNRFGKLVAQEPIDGNGWNGMAQGKLLPSDDYWYDITLVPANINKPTINKKGHFSLLRK